MSEDEIIRQARLESQFDIASETFDGIANISTNLGLTGATDIQVLNAIKQFLELKLEYYEECDKTCKKMGSKENTPINCKINFILGILNKIVDMRKKKVSDREIVKKIYDDYKKIFVELNYIYMSHPETKKML